MAKRYFLVEIDCNEDHDALPDSREVNLQVERSILDGGNGDPAEEFGILGCKCEEIHVDRVANLKQVFDTETAEIITRIDQN